MSQWNAQGYQVEITGDGSPTLRLTTDSSHPQESMHHSGGAASETKYIYGKSLSHILEIQKNPQVLVVGLGLGYIEILMADLCLQTQKIPVLNMLSFEKDKFLIQSFLSYLNNELTGELQETYDLVFQKIVEESRVNQVKAQLLDLYKSGQWKIEMELKKPFQSSQKFNVLQYDAFSSKTDQHLWDEEFLVEFLGNFAESPCTFATYACMGNLKRALKRTGFELEIRSGFQGKRNASFASRN